MKKHLILLFMLLLLIMAGCGSSPSAATTAPSAPPVQSAPPAQPAPPQQLSGYATYEDSTWNYSIQYPERLLFLSDGLTEEAKAEVLAILPEDMQGVDLNTVQAIWVEMVDEDAGFSTNLNVVASAADGMTQEMLQDPSVPAIFEEQLVQIYQGMLSDYKLLEPMSGKMFGDNFFLLCRSSYTQNGQTLYNTQAITAGGDSSLTFTLTSDKEDMAEAMPEFETMLSTLAFS